MKNIDELRKGFKEAIKINPSLQRVLDSCFWNDEISRFDSNDLHEYSLGVINGAWFMYQELNK